MRNATRCWPPGKLNGVHGESPGTNWGRADRPKSTRTAPRLLHSVGEEVERQNDQGSTAFWRLTSRRTTAQILLAESFRVASITVELSWKPVVFAAFFVIAGSAFALVTSLLES